MTERDDLQTNLISTENEICRKLGFKTEEPELDNWPDSGIKFLVAEELKEIGDQLVERFRPDLRHYNIVYVFSQKAGKSNGETTLGKAACQNDLQKALHGFDAIVQIGFDTWIELNQDQKFRLVYHELEHLSIDPEKDKIGVIDHTVREFASVIEVFGPGSAADVEFIAAYKRFQANNITLF